MELDAQYQADLPPFILQLFAKDTGFPIHIFEEPYFSHQLRLYSRMSSKVWPMWEYFLDALEQYGGPDTLVRAQYKLQDQLLGAVSSSAGYKNFKKTNEKEWKPKIPKSCFPLYQPHNDGKRVLSMDMKKANFQALHVFDPTIHLGASTWENFVSEFTDTEYFQNLRQPRQVLYGKLAVKKISQYQRYLMWSLVDNLEASPLCQDFGLKVQTLSTDEVILVGSQEDFMNIPFETFYMEPYRCIDNSLVPFLRVQRNEFTLKQLKPHKAFMRKFHGRETDTFDLKGVPKQWFCQALRYAFVEPVQELDLYFRHEGRLAKFVEPLEFGLDFREP